MIILSLSQNNLYLLFCCVLSIFLFRENLRDSVSLLSFPFLNHLQVFPCEISLICRLKFPYNFFFPFFLFTCCCCSVDPCVVWVVSSRCNPFFFFSFYEVFELFYRCIDAIFNAGKSSSSFVSLYSLSTSYLECTVMVFLFSDLLVEILPPFKSRMIPSILRGGQSRCLYFWWDFRYILFCFELFSRSPEIFF